VYSSATALSKRWLVLLLFILSVSGCLDKADVRPDDAAAAVAAGSWRDNNVAAAAAGPSAAQAAVAVPPAAESRQTKQAVEQIAGSIYRGDFKAAASKLEDVNAPVSARIAALGDVLSGYEALSDKRRLARLAELDEKLAELDKIRKEVADGNDVNDFSDVFSVVFAARELSEPNDKDKLLGDPFVRKMIDRSLVKAKEYESEGKWDEALSQCYTWMAAFNEDNEEYKEHRDRLREMYYIKESLTDNPCESRQQRFSGIKKEMFAQAIKVLDLYHIKILDYDEMAKVAIKRCAILGDVIAKADTFKADELIRTSGQIAGWQAGLNVYSDELKGSQLPLTKDKFLAMFENILKLNKNTLDLPEEIIVAFFAEASFDELDPYTNLVWPWQITEFEKSMTQEFTGIGIEINRTDGKLTVASLLPDTPASASGLDAEDVIEKVDGEATADMTLQCAVRKITGPAGTNVTLTVKHRNSETTEDIVITRAKIVVPTIRGWQRTDDGKWLYMIDPNEKIGYIRITNFAEKTSEQFESALDELEKQGMRALIVDLRYNTGGYLQSAVDICDKFISEGPIVSTRPRFGVRNSEVALRKGTHPNYPIVIIINGTSASASEIVAGALQDPMYRRALLVGSRSYGKGSVQTIFSFSGEKAQLKYTMAYYHLPSGQRVEGHYDAEKAGRKDWGIAPDITVDVKGDELKKLFDVQRDNDVLTKIGHDNRAAPMKRHSARELIDADPQLDVAVLAARTQLIAGWPPKASGN